MNAASTKQALPMRGIHEVTLGPMPVPSPRPHDLLIQTLAVTLCTSLRALSDPTLALHEIVTHALPFARWPEAFGLARNGHSHALKVTLTLPELA